MSLVLSRKLDQEIVIAGNIVVTVVEVRGNRVKLGIEAPPDVSVWRREVHDPRASQKERAGE